MTQSSENHQPSLFEEGTSRIELLPATKLQLQFALEALLREIAMDLTKNGDLAKKEADDDQDRG